MSHHWQLQTAKARFSELVKCALTQGPQNITVHGEPTVVLLSKKDYEKLRKPKNNFIDFMRHSPLVGLKLHIERDKSDTRDVDL